MNISFTVWAWIDDDIAIRWNISREWIIEWDKSLWDSQIEFDELIAKTFPMSKKDKIMISKNIYNEYNRASDEDGWINDFGRWLNIKLNKLNPINYD